MAAKALDTKVVGYTEKDNVLYFIALLPVIPIVLTLAQHWPYPMFLTGLLSKDADTSGY